MLWTHHLERLKNLTPSSDESDEPINNESTPSLLSKSVFFDKDIPSYEMYTITQFYLALVEAMEMAVLYSTNKDNYINGKQHMTVQEYPVDVKMDWTATVSTVRKVQKGK